MCIFVVSKPTFMGMNTILRHISHLLLADGYVSVSGVGVFVRQHCGATVASDGALTAPYDAVCFDACDTGATSEVLSCSIARAEGVTPDEAVRMMNDSIAALRSALGRGEEVYVPHAGYLCYDRDAGRITFRPEEVRRLRPVCGPGHPSEVRPAVAADDDGAKLEERRRSLARSLQRTASSAAAIAVLVLLAFVISQMPTRTEFRQQMASLGFERFASAEEPAAAPEELSASASSSQSSLVLILNTPEDGTAPAKVRRSVADAEQSAEPGRYCLIVASLANQDEADRYLAAHSTEDMPLKLLPYHDRIRVYALSGGNIGELEIAGRNLGVYERYPQAWICRR